MPLLMSKQYAVMNEKDTVLIDGACALCNRSARFIIKSGGGKKYRFVALGTEEAKKILEKYGFSGDYKDSVCRER
jgi:predicted DCC family thiol-disulfide oxidoreductase YuxK